MRVVTVVAVVVCAGALACGVALMRQQPSRDEKTLQAADIKKFSGVVAPTDNSGVVASQDEPGFSYVRFAQEYPFANNLLIASAKTAAAGHFF